MKLFLPIKINYGLKIVGQDEDGYHLLDSLFVALKGGDHIKISFASRFRVAYTGRYVTKDLLDKALSGQDTVSKAFRCIRKKFGEFPSVSVKVNKNIPPGTGLGAGSADAAALFYFYWKKGLIKNPNEAELAALEVGSDVPFFLKVLIEKCPAIRVRGKGEILDPVEEEFAVGNRFLVVIPEIFLKTADVYRAYDELHEKGFDFSSYDNDLFPAALTLAPRLEAFSKMGMKFTGSGSAFFLDFNCKKEALNFLKKVKMEMGRKIRFLKVLMTEIYNFRGVRS